MSGPVSTWYLVLVGFESRLNPLDILVTQLNSAWLSLQTGQSEYQSWE